jgi:hypothetical protein
MNRSAKYPTRRTLSRVAPLLALLLAIAGCGDASDAALPTESTAASAVPAAGEPASEVDLLRAVRQEAVRFRSTDEAALAGYEPTDHCVPGMGYHWLKPSLVDPVFDPLQPEVVLYAPGPDGRPKLVAVEYIVIDAGQPAPTFGEQPFDVGGTPVPVPHWSLHVWLYGENPDGIFTAYNQRVACAE